MRRALPVIATTAGGLALLANFHTSSAATTVASGPAANQAPPPAAGADPSGNPTAPPSTRATTTTSPSSSRTVTGPVAYTDYGDVQVQVVLNGGKIVDVKALQLPSDRQRSARISQEAGPILRQEVLQAQSADIDLVSGATYTSDGYVRSLQAALAQVNH